MHLINTLAFVENNGGNLKILNSSQFSELSEKNGNEAKKAFTLGKVISVNTRTYTKKNYQNDVRSHREYLYSDEWQSEMAGRVHSEVVALTPPEPDRSKIGTSATTIAKSEWIYGLVT